jgi:hypothetical protein
MDSILPDIDVLIAMPIIVHADGEEFRDILGILHDMSMQVSTRHVS